MGPTTLQEGWDSGKEMGVLSFRREGVKTQGLKKKNPLTKNPILTHTHTLTHSHKTLHPKLISAGNLYRVK